MNQMTARLARGLLGGIVAGGVFILVTMWFEDSMGGEAEMPFRMISTLVLGDGALADMDTNVGVGVLVHFVLSAAFGVGFAMVAPMIRGNGSTVVAATIYGGLLFVVNFYIMAETWATSFQMPNKPFELLAHLVFGTILGFAFLTPDRSEGLIPAIRRSAAGVR